MRFSGQKVPKTEGFLRFYFFWSNPLRESGCRVSKTECFLRIFFGPVHPSQGKRGSSVKNWGFFAFLVRPKVSWELSWRLVLLHTAVFSRSQKWAKIAKKREKLMVFWRFFNVRSNPLRESGCRVSKTDGFLRFWCARICPNNLFCYIRPLQTLSQGAPRWCQTSLNQSETRLMVLEWFQRALKLTFFWKEDSETAVWLLRRPLAARRRVDGALAQPQKFAKSKKIIQRLTPFWGSNFGPQNGNPERKNESLTPFWGPKFGPQNWVSHQGRFARFCCLNWAAAYAWMF